MPQPAAHAALLARRDFRFPPGEYTEAERVLLEKFGRWLEGLATGSISPLTPAQTQFVESARGRRDPETDFERAWRTVLRNRGIGFDVGETFQALVQARAYRAALEDEYAAARSVVLAKVKAELAAVDEAFAARLADATDAAAAAEQAARDNVLSTGKNIYIAGIRAIYSSPRVSWDTPKLDAYAQQHPEVLEFRKFGKAFVNMRFQDTERTPGEATPPAADAIDDEPEPL